MVGDNIKGFMKKKGINQREMGLLIEAELGIPYSQSTVSKKLSNEENISVKELRAIAKILETTLEKLIN